MSVYRVLDKNSRKTFVRCSIIRKHNFNQLNIYPNIINSFSTWFLIISFTLSSKGIMTLFNLQSGIKRHSSTTKVGSNLYYNLFRYTKYPMKNRYFDSRLLLNFMLSAAQEVTGCSLNPEWILGEEQGNSSWLIYLKLRLNLNKQGARK